MTNQNKAVANFESTITAGATKYIDLDADRTVDDNGQKTNPLVPFRNAVIYNNGNALLKVFVNGRKGYKFIPKGTIFTIDDDRIRGLRIVNPEAVDGSYKISFDSEETQISLLKGMLGKMLNKQVV